MPLPAPCTPRNPPVNPTCYGENGRKTRHIFGIDFKNIVFKCILRRLPHPARLEKHEETPVVVVRTDAKQDVISFVH